ncbi:MAG: hypothetical protein GX638_12600 [Crenarchaeota archaeon]|nr:hypothetical protein [Thermoproteota archaeon]
MTIIQHYYTSVEGKGFQTSEIDGNLDYDLIKEIERRGNYSAPRNLPTNPSDNELDLFPISYSFYKKEGKYIITHSKYIGKEFTGRFGNYFAHSLIFDTTSDIFNLSPIQLWDADFWVYRDGNEIQQILTFYPELNINSIKQFYSQRKEQISQFLVALNQFLQTKKRIIIVDSTENVAKMIYLASLFVPNSIFMEKISFTTYTVNPNFTNYSICGTTKDSEFNFSSDDYKEYNIFNFFEEKFPTQLNNKDFLPLFRLLDGNNVKNFEKYFEKFLKGFNNISDNSDLLMIHDISYVTVAKEVPEEIKTRIISYIDKNEFPSDEKTKRIFLKKKYYDIYEHIFFSDVKKPEDKTKKFIEYSNLLIKNASSDISKKYIDRAFNKIWNDKTLEFEEIQQLVNDPIFCENVGGQWRENIVKSLLKYKVEDTTELIRIVEKKRDLLTLELKEEIKKYKQSGSNKKGSNLVVYLKILILVIAIVAAVIIILDYMNIYSIPNFFNHTTNNITLPINNSTSYFENVTMNSSNISTD